MKKILSLVAFLGIYMIGNAQSCDLFFSEYIEGASNNKAIEIYNPLTTSVNLSNYKIFRYNNGSTTPSDSLQPLGTLLPGAVFVAGNPSAVSTITTVSDTLHTITFYNGDDAIELRYMPTGTSLDIIGIIGNDPGTNWPVGTGATSEFTLVRMLPITHGQLNWAIGATEWDVYPQNTDIYLGSHSGAPCCTPTSSSVSAAACDSYTWAENGMTYTVSGSYFDTLVNAAGCDSIISLNLNISSSFLSTEIVSSCESYTWPVNNMTYTVSGIYNNTLLTVGGCDSIQQLDLTITLPTTSSISVAACNSYTWPQNGMTYTTSGSYFDTLVNAANCDSIISLNLTISTSFSSSESLSACESYTWSVTGMTYTTSGIFSDTLVSVGGCDSIVTLDLTIITPPIAVATDNGAGTLTATGGTPIQWINCATNMTIAGATSSTFTPTANGTYAAVVGSTCTDTSDCLVVDYIGLNEYTVITATIYPNPATDLIQIDFAESTAQLRILDAQGKTILTTVIEKNESLSVASLEKGVYFFELITPTGIAINRVVKN